MDEIKIDINTAEDYAREQTWEFKVPRAPFSTFHCKYQISVTQKLLDTQIGYHGKAGYIFLQVEQYGFDEEVTVMVQPRTGFVDYSSTEKESDSKYRVY